MRLWTGGTRAGAQGAAAVALTLALGACGSTSTPSHSTSSPAAAAPARVASLQGPVVADPVPAPQFALRNYLGHRIALGGYRGRAVLLTFIYTHCPDVCPLIVANLHNALARLGADAAKVQIIAVSTDPRGDTRAAVTAFLAHRGMTGRMQYLVGTRRALVPVWKAYGVNVTHPTASDAVGHSAIIYGITAGGHVKVAYPANFTPAMLAHDVPLLAGM